VSESAYLPASTCTCTHDVDHHTAHAVGIGVTDLGLGACTSCACPMFDHSGPGGNRCAVCGVVTPPAVDADPAFRGEHLSCWRDEPWVCVVCGELDSCRRDGPSCSCWANVSDVPLADLKAMLAGSGLNVATDGRLS